MFTYITMLGILEIKLLTKKILLNKNDIKTKSSQNFYPKSAIF